MRLFWKKMIRFALIGHPRCGRDEGRRIQASQSSHMPLTRSHSISFLMVLGIVLACGLVLSPASSLAQVESPAKAEAKLPPLKASHPRGLCDAPFSLTLTTPSEGAVIRYTQDGTEPTPANGDTYKAPLKISRTTLLRAAAFKERTRVSAVTTFSYLFVDQILQQPQEPEGFPFGPRAWS